MLFAYNPKNVIYNHTGFYCLITKLCEGNVFSLFLSVILSTGEFHENITHDLLDLTIQEPLAPVIHPHPHTGTASYKDPHTDTPTHATLYRTPLNLPKLLQLEPHCTRTPPPLPKTCSNVFIVQSQLVYCETGGSYPIGMLSCWLSCKLLLHKTHSSSAILFFCTASEK